MIYHKFETEHGYVINEIYDDEFVAYCGGCDMEMKLCSNKVAQLLKNGDFSGTVIYCQVCSKEGAAS